MSGFKPAYALATITVLCLATVAACDDDETQPAPTATTHPPTLTPLATPTPAPTATPQAIDGVEVVPLRVGGEAEIPDDVALIIETGCFYCDGPPGGLYRLYLDASGQPRTDKLFPAETAGFQTDQSAIHSYALNTDASEIVVSICTRGECAWIDPAGPDAQTTLFRSLDGGVTWSEFGVLDGSHFLVTIAKEGLLITGPYDQGPDSRPTYELFPSGQPVQPPPGAGEAWPLSLPSGELIWRSKDGRLLRSDGSEFLDLGEDVSSVNAWGKNIQLDPGGEHLALVWSTQDHPNQTVQDYLGVGTLDGRLTTVFSVPGITVVGGWVDSNVLLGSSRFSPEELGTTEGDPDFFGYLPALFELGAGQRHPLNQPFHDPPFKYQRNFVRAVLHGPFARVVNTGSCLSVRAEPGMAADALTCAADDVLLRDTGETREADGEIWLRVVTPAGVEGWASEEYLER
jgi:hypothetical protein